MRNNTDCCDDVWSWKVPLAGGCIGNISQPFRKNIRDRRVKDGLVDLHDRKVVRAVEFNREGGVVHTSQPIDHTQLCDCSPLAALQFLVMSAWRCLQPRESILKNSQCPRLPGDIHTVSLAISIATDRHFDLYFELGSHQHKLA